MTRCSSVCSSLGYFSFKVGVWGVWLYGFLLICLSLYATQRLPSIRDQIIKIPKLTHKGFGFGNGNGNSGGPTITIFSAPSPPFDKSMLGARQALAVRSWLALSPGVMVVLFGKHPSILSFAAGLGSRVSVESRIDFTFLGTPFFHSMVARSRASSSDISVMVDPEIILLPDFISTLHYAHKLEHDWLLVAMPRNVSHFPFNLDETGQHWLREDGKQMKERKLQEFLVQKGHWSGCSGRLLMAWNTGELPLHAGVLPPFLFRKGLHYHWVVTESLSSGFRFVFDASEVISSFYPEIVGRFPSIKGSDNGDIRERLWEYRGNSHLAAVYGSYYFNLANFSNSLIRFVKCDGKYLFFNIAQEIVYTFQAHLPTSSTLQRASSQGKGKGRSSIWTGKIFELKKEKKWMACVEDSILLDRKMECSIKDSFNLSSPLYLPFSLELLLRTVADEDRSVVLAVAGNNYRDMLMSWVCRLRRLSVSNFIICAIDPEIYQFSVLQGLPVFKDPLAPTNISYNDCHFGTKCFQRVTKVKSRLVLQILRLGYNVLLSDVDVYWFSNPLPYLLSFGPAILVAQSDEYKETGPINLPRRLNSGFYFAHADRATISAMDKVVKHALASDLSEQPSFYDVLCGEGGANRLGDDRCLEPDTNLTVHFLDRNLFPNGAHQGLWEKDDVKAACVKSGCLILHNNWISGREKKLERQLLSGLWDYDSSTSFCLCHKSHEASQREPKLLFLPVN
ncbi:hypothetical protein AAC387_Pa05g1264 [Persea americana]